MNIIDFVAVAFAIDAVVTAWFYGTLFESARAYWERRGGFLGELLGCPLCFTYHAAAWIIILFLIPSFFLPSPWDWLVKLPIYILGSTSLVHLIQGVHPRGWPDDEEEQEEPDETEAIDREIKK